MLMVLCFRANQHHEVYSSIKKLSINCKCSIKTIERTLKKLRDKGYLIYTGKLAPQSKSIPIYKIDLTHGQNGGGLNLPTDNLSFTDGQIGNLPMDKLGIRINNINKDNKKDIDSFFNSYRSEINDVMWFIKSDHKLPNELQFIYFWLLEHKFLDHIDI